MDMEDIHYLLGGTIFARAENYMKHIESFDCETEENGVRHLCAEIEGSGDHLYTTEAWLRQNGSFVSASCTCPYNDNGNGLFCEHIGALLLYDLKEQKTVKVQRRAQTEPAEISGVVRGVANLPEKPAEEPEAHRKDSYVSGLEMLFGKKWRSDEPESDDAARALLRTYQEGALAELEDNTLPQRTGFVELEPELTLLQYGTPWLRLRISLSLIHI